MDLKKGDQVTEDSPSLQMIGLLMLAVLCAALYFIWVSAPISLYCLGGLGVGWTLKAINQAIEKNLPKPAPLRARLPLAVSKDAARLISGLGIGAAAVWAMQTVLRLGSFVPAAVGDFQIRVYNFSAALKQSTSLPVALGAVAFALALSLSINALWPLNVLARVRKAAGVATSLLAAFLSFGFVGVPANAGSHEAPAARIESPANGIRARIVGKLDQLIVARRSGAALQWLGESLLGRRAPSAVDAKVAAAYFSEGGKQCATADALFAKGIRSVSSDYYYSSRDPFCDADWYRESMAEALERLPRPQGGAAPATAWIPEYAGLTVAARPAGNATVAYPPGRSFDLRPDIRSSADLQMLLKDVDLKLNDAVSARKSVEGTVAKLLETQFKGVLGEVPDLAAKWTDPLIGILAEEAVGRVSDRLRALRLPLPEAAHQLLNAGVEPLAIEQPASRVRKVGSMAKALTHRWRSFLISKEVHSDPAPDSEWLERAGAYVARHEQEVRETEIKAEQVRVAQQKELRDRVRENSGGRERGRR